VINADYASLQRRKAGDAFEFHDVNRKDFADS